MTLADTYKDKYSFFVDPNGSDPKNPGDALWQTCGLYFSYCVLGIEDSEYFHGYCCKEYDADPIRAVENLLINYYEYCCFPDKMITHPLRLDHFSRDQLAQLLLLISAVKRYQPHLAELAKKILQHIVMLDAKNAGSLHSDKESKDNLNDANRFIIYELCKVYGISYPETSEKCFSYALKSYEFAWKIGVNNPRPYTIWNNLGLLTAIFIHYPKMAKLREYFSWFADNGWGPAYKIVANKPVDASEIDFYADKKTEHIDIAQQRGTGPKWGSKPCLDYPITRALLEVWR